MLPPTHEASIFRPTKSAGAGSVQTLAWGTAIATGVRFVFQPMGGAVVAQAFGREARAMGRTFWPAGTDLRVGDGVLITAELREGTPLEPRWEVRSSHPRGGRWKHRARLERSVEAFG